MKKIIRAVCGIMLVLAVLAAAPLFSANADGSNAPDLRYGTGDDRDTVLFADALFALIYPDAPALTPGEAAYLRGETSLALRYRSDIPDALVNTAYNGDAGTLTVSVSAYSYVAENGETVRWVPVSVSMDGEPDVALSEQDGQYTAVYGDLWYSDVFDLTVKFVWNGTLPAAAADALLTEPSAAATAAIAARGAYETEKATYDAHKAAYETYLEAKTAYDAGKSDYDAYLAAKSDYDVRKAAYDVYFAEKAEYDAAVAAYDANSERQAAYERALTAYYAYEEQRKQNVALYDRYEEYVNAMEQIAARLGVLESMFVSDSHGWQFYGSLMGGTVDSVLEKRAELMSLRVSAVYIDNAKEATDALRELMHGYAELRNAAYPSDFAKQTALFAYYCEHYAELRDQTARLFDNIHAIYSYPAVRKTMESNPKTKEKMPHFRQFLAQLYVLKSCLNDIETLDFDWTLPQNDEALTSLVEEPLRPTDTNRADPTGVAIPTEEIALNGELPEPVEKPTKDFVELEDPRLRGEPEPIADPGEAPPAVADPGEAPDPVEPYGEKPVEPNLTAAERALADEMKNGELPARSPNGGEVPFALTCTVDARRSIRNCKTVTFYDENDTPVAVREADYGAEITDPPSLRRTEDGAYSYTFLGWIPYGSLEETPVSLANITENLSLSPLFSRRAKTYEITWSVAGRTAVEYYRYGEVPICPFDPVGAWNDPSKVYTFTGWDVEPQAVTGTAIYTACYESATAIYTVTWDLGNRSVSEQLSYGATPHYAGSTERATDHSVYAFRGWDRPVSLVMGDATYRAVWEVTPLVANATGEACRTEQTETTVTVYPEQDVIDINTVSAYARSEGKTLFLRRGAMALSFTPAELERLFAARCTKLVFFAEPTGSEGGMLFRVECRNSLGRELQTGLTFSVVARYPASEGLYTAAYRVDGAGNRTEIDVTRYAGGRAVFAVGEGEAVVCRPEYLLQYTDENELCNPTLLPKHAEKGTTVSLATDCAYGYEVSGATLVYASGRIEEVGPVFSMPAERVRVLLKVTPIVYRVTFSVDGAIVSEQELSFGEAVALPPDPVKEDDGEYRYLFAGWSPYVTRATGEERSPCYVATFSATPIAKDTFRVDGGSFFRSPLFLGATATVAVIAAAVVLIAFRKKIFRKRGKNVGKGTENATEKAPAAKDGED